MPLPIATGRSFSTCVSSFSYLGFARPYGHNFGQLGSPRWFHGSACVYVYMNHQAMSPDTSDTIPSAASTQGNAEKFLDANRRKCSASPPSSKPKRSRNAYLYDQAPTPQELSMPADFSRPKSPVAHIKKPDAPPSNRMLRDLDKLQRRRLKNKIHSHKVYVDKFGEEPIMWDIRTLLGEGYVRKLEQDADVPNSDGAAALYEERFERGTELVVRIERLASHGEGLAVAPTKDWVIAVPFALPGELVRCRVYANERLFSNATLLEVLERARGDEFQRRDDLVGCRYFGKCSGCQYQMLSYDDQLRQKQRVVTNAFTHYSHISPSLLPAVDDTIGSPKPYSYRTKLTPHFEMPAAIRRHRKTKVNARFLTADVIGPVDVGFDKVDGGGVLDIEECPIATNSINSELPKQRNHVKKFIQSYKNGATVLLRDSLKYWNELAPESTAARELAPPPSEEPAGKDLETPNVHPAKKGEDKGNRKSLQKIKRKKEIQERKRARERPEQAESIGSDPTLKLSAEDRNEMRLSVAEAAAKKNDDASMVVTDHHEVVREVVGDVLFESPAGAFFQNNRSVLPSLLAYVRDQIINLHNGSSANIGKHEDNHTYAREQSSQYLIDAYCGSGFFALSLAPMFKRVAGIEISEDSIESAIYNAQLNAISNVSFIAGQAQAIFEKIDFPPDETTIVIDPPRRGCDDVFISQLLRLRPAHIVYVSCNVHTQARDVGQIVAQSWQKDFSATESPGQTSEKGGVAKTTPDDMAPVKGIAQDHGNFIFANSENASCEKHTQYSTNIPVLKKGYRVVSIRGIDLFPQTHHVEGVCILSRI